MKRFELWVTAAIMFSLPALGFAQATGGSPGKQGKLRIYGTAAGTGRKGTVESEIRKKGSGNAQKKAGTLNPQPLPPITHAPDKGQKKIGTINQPLPPIIHAPDKGSGNAQSKKNVIINQPLPPIIRAPKKGSGNAPKTTGNDTPTQVPQKKPPRPRAAKDVDKKK